MTVHIHQSQAAAAKSKSNSHATPVHQHRLILNSDAMHRSHSPSPPLSRTPTHAQSERDERLAQQSKPFIDKTQANSAEPSLLRRDSTTQFSRSRPSARYVNSDAFDKWETSPLAHGEHHGTVASLYSNQSRWQQWKHDVARHYTCCNRCKGWKMSRAKFYTINCGLCLLLSAAFAVFALLVLTPIIVRFVVGQSELDFHDISISSPTTRGMHLYANGVISGTPPGLNANIAEMRLFVSQVLADKSLSRLGYMTMAPLSVNGATKFVADSDFHITDPKAFDRFTHALIFDKSIQWHLQSEAAVTPSLGPFALPTYRNIPFEKSIVIPSCGGLKDVELLVFDMSRSTAQDVVLALQVRINNPSIFNINPMGNLAFDMYYNKVFLGSVYAYNSQLNVGQNIMNMTGLLKPTDMNVAMQLINRFLTGKDTHVSAVASKSAASTVPLYNSSMQGLELGVTLKGNKINLIRSMVFDSMDMKPSTTDQTVRIQASLTIQLESPLGHNSPLNLETLDMNAHLLFRNKSVGALTVPKSKITSIPEIDPQTGRPHPFSLTFTKNIDSLMVLDDVEWYKTFVSAFENGESIDIEIKGTSNVVGTYALGPLIIQGLPIDSMVHLRGLDGFKTCSVKDLHLPSNRQCDASRQPDGLCGVNANVDATIFNPGVTVVHLGRTSMEMRYKNCSIGVVGSNDLSLQTGLNQLSLSGYVLPRSRDLKVVGQFFSDYMNGKSSQVELFGIVPQKANGSPATDSASLTISTLHMKTMVNGPKGIKLLKKVHILNFGVGLVADESAYASSQINVDFAMPDNCQFPLTVEKTSMTFTIDVPDAPGSQNYIPIASMTLTDLPVVHRPSSDPTRYYDSLHMQFDKMPLHIIDKQRFAAFSSSLMLTPRADFRLVGQAQPTASTQMGKLSLTGIPVLDSISLTGFNSFMSSDGRNTPLIKVTGLDIMSATPHMMQVSTQVVMYNPSPQVYILAAGDLTLDIYMGGVALVRVMLNNFSLKLGQTQATGYGVYIPPTGASAPQGVQFMSNVVNGKDTYVQMTGRLHNSDGSVQAGTTIPALVPAMLAFSPMTIIPGLTGSKAIVVSADLIIPLINIPKIALVQKIPARMRMHNPFSTDLYILSTDVNMYRNSDLTGFIGNWHDEYTTVTDYIHVPAHQTIDAKQIIVKTKFNIAEIRTLFELLGKGTKITAAGKLHVSIGGMPGTGMTQDIDLFITDISAMRTDG